jgi:cellulose synthase/poly-beta-1,6-N-acetylglucosamine synthase-like glycosyltransferase
MTTLTIFCTGFVVISAIYFFIIILINVGIFRLKRFVRSADQLLTTVSIIIPARNEEENIGHCLRDLESQDYPLHLVEVIVVNDHSTDLTEERVSGFAQSHPSMNLRLILTGAPGNNQAFKKRSIRSGVDASTGDLIITTDADTWLKSGWISSIVDFYERQDPKMIIGPVAFHEETSFFERLQSMEFFGLMAATAGSCNMGFPLMCNGANLAFERKAYLETRDSEDDLRYPSGDDLFLMMKIRKKYGAKSVKYLFAEEAMVSTKAKKTLREFFAQRLRWVSKSRGYTDHVVMAVAIVTWLFNFLLLSTLVAGIFSLHLLFFSLFLLGIKMILELPAVFRIMALSAKTKLWYLYPVTQVLNLVYVSLVGILGNVVSYEWKGRKISPVKRNIRE